MADGAPRFTQRERAALAEAMVEAEELGGSQAWDFNVHVWRAARAYPRISTRRRRWLRFGDMLTWMALGGLILGAHEYRLWALGALIVGATVSLVATPKPGFSTNG